MSLKNLLGFSLGPLSSAAIGLISIPIVTRLVLPDIYAQISLVQVTIQLLLFACLAGLDQGYVREFYEVKNKKKLLSYTLGINIIISLISIFLIYLFSIPLANFLFGQQNELAIIILCSTLFLTILLRYIQLSLRMKGEAIGYSLVLFLQSITTLIFIISFIKLNILSTLNSVLLANSSSILIVVIVGVIKLNPSFPIKLAHQFDKPLLLSLCRYSAPLFVSTVLMWILYSADQYMLRILGDFNDLGLYSAAYKLCAALTVLQMIISTYWVPLSLKWAKNNETIKSYERAGFFVSIALLTIFLLIILFKDILILLLGKSYRDALMIFPYLLMYPIYYALAEVASSGISISRKTHVLVPITFICAALNIAINYYLIPIWGAKGAAISTAITFLLYFYLRLFWSNKVWKKVSYFSYHYLSFQCLIILVLIDNILIPYIAFTFLLINLIGVYLKEKEQINAISKGLLSSLKKQSLTHKN